MPRNWLSPIAWVAAVSAALLLLFPVGFPNYDTIYALLWGREMADGLSPDMAAPLAPTPHPLAELFGLLATPLGNGAIEATMVVAYLSLGLVGYLVYRLGALWFDRSIGAVAALIVLSRAPYLSNGLRAYVDLPYIALCLGALLIETKRPRSGWPVLALLALAGLLRPEAWLFSLAYLAYLLLAPPQASKAAAVPDEATGARRSSHQPGPEEEMRAPLDRADTQSAGLIRPALGRARGALISSRGIVLAALALAAPIAWALFDWITAGSPTYSFTGTRETVDTLARQTGPVDLVLYGPRRLGEVLQWPGMVGALGGVALGLAFLRRRSTIGVAAATLALAAFAVLASAGLAILPRYTMLAAAVLAIFAALALLGWRLLEAGHPWRRAWQAFAALVVLMFLAWSPNQYDLLHRVDTDLTNQGRIEGDLTDLAETGAFAWSPPGDSACATGERRTKRGKDAGRPNSNAIRPTEDAAPRSVRRRQACAGGPRVDSEPLCGPIAVPNHRAVPRLAFNLDIRPTQMVSASEQRPPGRGYYLEPASPFVIHNFILDPGDPTRLTLDAPPGFREVARNESWVLYKRCR